MDTKKREILLENITKLSDVEIDSVWNFVEFLKFQKQVKVKKNNTHNNEEKILTNEEIDLILEQYKKEGKKRPIGLAKGEFIVPDDFNDPLPDEIIDLFYPQ